MEEIYFDDEKLGRVIIRESKRAKSYFVKVCGGRVYGIVPLGGSLKTMISVIRSDRDKYYEILQRLPAPIGNFNEESKLSTATFDLRIVRTDRENFYMSLREGILQIACPRKTNFQDEKTQLLLKSMLGSALRHEAKRVLPSRLENLARAHGFKYSAVKITSSRRRWGSCSAKGGINLSFSVMLLPFALVDYVLLHELCHTVEMNHGPKFRALLDRVTQGQAKALHEELSKYRAL